MKYTLLAMTLLACKPTPSSPIQDVEAGVGIASGVCTIIESVTDDGTILTICATIQEIATVFGSTDPATLTPAQRAVGIRAIVALRTARLMLDAGSEAGR